MKALVQYIIGNEKGFTMVYDYRIALNLKKAGVVKILKIYDNEPNRIIK